MVLLARCVMYLLVHTLLSCLSAFSLSKKGLPDLVLDMDGNTM